MEALSKNDFENPKEKNLDKDPFENNFEHESDPEEQLVEDVEENEVFVESLAKQLSDISDKALQKNKGNLLPILLIEETNLVDDLTLSINDGIGK